MRKRNVMLLVGLLLILLVLAGCCKDKVQVQVQGTPEEYPPWYLSQDDPDYVCAYGFATKANQRASVESARENAMQEIAYYVEARVTTMLKDYIQEAGEVSPQVLSLTESAAKTVSEAKFSGVITGKLDTRQVEVDGDTRYKSYIQLKVPAKQVNKGVYDFVRSEEAMYSEFKASQAFQELERSLEKD